MFDKYSIITEIINEISDPVNVERGRKHLAELILLLKEEDEARHAEVDELYQIIQRRKFKMEEKLTLIAQIKATLNNVTVSGRSNMSSLLGSIQALDRLEEMIQMEEVPKVDNNNE